MRTCVHCKNVFGNNVGGVGSGFMTEEWCCSDSCRKAYLASRKASTSASGVSQISTSGPTKMGPLDYLVAHGVIAIAFAIGSATLANYLTRSISYDWILWIKGAIVVVSGIIGYVFAMHVWRIIKYIGIAVGILIAIVFAFLFVKTLVSK